MKASSNKSSRAFAASRGTWISSTSLAPSGARRSLSSRGLARSVDAADEAGDALAEGKFVAVLYPLAVYGSAVEERAVGGAEILDYEAIFRARDPGVLP